jgi:hypothetical protein
MAFTGYKKQYDREVCECFAKVIIQTIVGHVASYSDKLKAIEI